MKKKAIVSSVLSIAMCASLVTGATFALFTSETKTNIAIQSGNVSVTSWIDEKDIVTYSFGQEQKDDMFELGGSATYDTASNKLTVDKIAPGDKVDFKVYVENGSDITVSYRVKVAFAGELQDALVAYVTFPGEQSAEEEVAATELTSNYAVTEWKSFGDDKVITLPMSVELPYTVGNEYKGKSAEIVVTVEAVQGNATNLIMIGDTKYDTLTEAVAAAKNGDVIGLSGDFTLPVDGSLANKELTFAEIADGIAVIDMKNVHTGQSTSGATLTFEGVTVEFDNTANYKGIAHATKVVYNDCTLIGKQFMYAPTVEFTDCEFINYNDYVVWTYGAENVTFTDCTFTTGGKAVLVYTEAAHTATHTYTNCTFNSNGQLATDKAAVEVGESANGNKATYTINLNNCKQEGFAPNMSNNALWGNKNSMDNEHLIVSIDGVAVNTVTNKYTITSAEELKNILTMAGTAGANNSIIELTADVKLTEAWTPVKVDGYHGADVITLNGNKHTISGLTAPLFSGGFAGGSGIVINDLTIADSTMVSTSTQGSGAFIECVDSMDVITLKNCHLKNSTIQGSRTGGLIGWTSGYDNTNDGAVKTYVTVENCSVIGCTIENTFSDEGTTPHTESVGAIFGHAGANPWTFTTIKNCIIKDNTIIGGDGKTGVILGTANLGEVTITGCTMENNKVNGAVSNAVYGRLSFGSTGKLTVDGTEIK